jgi:hypothetical protein
LSAVCLTFMPELFFLATCLCESSSYA